MTGVTGFLSFSVIRKPVAVFFDAVLGLPFTWVMVSVFWNFRVSCSEAKGIATVF